MKTPYPYSVAGEVITRDHVVAAMTLMQKRGEFTFSDVGGALIRAGVTWQNHERAADRLLQWLRKQRQVKFSKGSWTICKNDEGITQ